MSGSAFLCQTCRRQFPLKESLDRHCCSSVQLEPCVPQKLNGKRKGVNGDCEPEKKKKQSDDDDGAWTEQEEAILEDGVKEFGTNWTLILYKFGSSFSLDHQQPCVLAAKWSEMVSRKTSVDVKPFAEAQAETLILDMSAVVGEAEVKVDVHDAAEETLGDESGDESVSPTISQPKLKLLVVPKRGRKLPRSKNDEDDEDYVPELGADSDSDCSEAATEGVDGGSDEDDEEIVEEEEEEEVVEEAGVELTLSADDVSDNALIFTPTVLSIPAASASASQADATHVVVDDNPASSSSSIFSPTYLYLAEAGSVAFPVTSIHVTNSYSLPPCSTSSAPPSIAYAALSTPPDDSHAPTTVSTAPPSRIGGFESSDASMMSLPSEFQNLINSQEFQRLLFIPVVELLAPGSRGHDLLISVLSELARIFAFMYPGSRTNAAASKFLDAVCMPWIRSFLPHFLCHSEMNITFEGEDEPRPLLTGIQSKVRRLFLFYLNVLPPNPATIAVSAMRHNDLHG